MSGLVGLFVYGLLSGGFVIPGVLVKTASGQIPYTIVHLSILVILIADFIVRFKDPEEKRKTWPIKTFFQQMGFVIGGGLFVFLLARTFGISSVVLSSVVGIFVGSLWPAFATAAFCGSFVGMASPDLFCSGSLFLATLFASVMFYIGGRNYLGIGGKLGTTAFFGVLLMALIQGKSLIEPWNPDGKILPVLIVLGAVGCLATYYCSEKRKMGPVVGSGIVGIVGGILLPLLDPTYGALYANLVFCASFAGMASRRILQRWPLFAISGALCGLLFYLTRSYFDGIGGKLGTIAFVSVLVVQFAFRPLIRAWKSA